MSSFTGFPIDHYDSTISEVVNELENDITQYNSKCEKQGITKVVYSIIAYIAFNGIIISTTIYSQESNNELDSESINNLTENYYFEINKIKLAEKISIKTEDANKERKRQERKRREEIKEEIKNRIEKNENLRLMTKKTQRNEYANTIIAELYRKEGFEFLSKGEIRDLVEKVYYSLLTENDNQLKFE